MLLAGERFIFITFELMPLSINLKSFINIIISKMLLRICIKAVHNYYTDN